MNAKYIREQCQFHHEKVEQRKEHTHDVSSSHSISGHVSGTEGGPAFASSSLSFSRSEILKDVPTGLKDLFRSVNGPSRSKKTNALGSNEDSTIPSIAAIHRPQKLEKTKALGSNEDSTIPTAAAIHCSQKLSLPPSSCAMPSKIATIVLRVSDRCSLSTMFGTLRAISLVACCSLQQHQRQHE